MSAHENRPTKETGHLHPTDLELVQMARLGDDAAFHELVDRFASELYALARSLVGNAADAEDVLQETFTGAFRHLRAFEERASVRTWLVRILVRQAARCRRDRDRRRTESPGGAGGWMDGAGPEAHVVPPSDALDVRMDLLEVLSGLSPEHREVMVLRELEGMSYDEIAGVLGVPRGTVESRLFRAREKLRERLRGYLT